MNLKEFYSKNKKAILLICFVLLIITISSFGIYLFFRQKDSNKKKSQTIILKNYVLTNADGSVSEYNANAKLIKKYIYKNPINKTQLTRIEEYDHLCDNKNPINIINYNDDGITVMNIEKFEYFSNDNNSKKSKIIKLSADGKKYIEMLEYNGNDIGKTKLTNFQADGKTIDFFNIYNPQNYKIISSTKYNKDNKKIIFNQYNENGKLITETFYQADGVTIKQINHFDPQATSFTKKIKTEEYQSNGLKLSRIKLYNSQTGNPIEEKILEADGIKICRLEKYDLTGEKLTKVIWYQQDNTFPWKEIFYNSQGRIINEIEYSTNTKRKKETLFDPLTEQIIEEKNYFDDGEKINIIEIFDRNTGNQLKKIKYRKNEQTILYIQNYDEENNEIDKVYYQVDGQTISKVEE